MKLDTSIPISSISYNGINIPLVGNTSSTPAIFGDGSDGVGLFTANTIWNAPTEDTGMIIKNFESLTIAVDTIVSAGNRNCGMIIRVKGNCTIHGTLANKMSPKTILDSDGVDFSIYPASMLSTVAGSGGKGGTGGGFLNKGQGGEGQAGRFYGGGYSGGGGGASSSTNTQSHHGGNGGSAVNITTATPMFVGGVGYTIDVSNSPTDGTYGGGGGGWIKAGGSGAGAAGGDAGSDNSGGGGAGNYGGGVIILLVGGSLTITGSIDCSGNKGGTGGSGEGAGGGGGGGGRIFICHKGEISNTGVLNVNGGAGGNGGATTGYGETASNFAGTAGSIGTTAIKTYEQYMKEDVA